MPIFHFNLHDGADYPDALGTDCSDIPGAKVEAATRMARLLGEEAARFWTGDEWTMSVTDDKALVLFTLVFYGMDAAAISKPVP